MTNKKHQMYTKIILALAFMILIAGSKAQSNRNISNNYPYISANPQNEFLAMIYPDRIEIVDFQSGDTLNTISGFSEDLYPPLVWSMSGTHIAFTRDGYVEVWANVADEQQSTQIGIIELQSALQLNVPLFRPSGISWFNEDKNILLIQSSRISIWDVLNDEISESYLLNNWEVLPFGEVSQRVSDNLFLFADSASAVHLIDVISRQELNIVYLPLQLYATFITSLSLSNDKTRVAIAESAYFTDEGGIVPGKIFIWDLANNAEFYVPLTQASHPGHGEELTTALSWSPDDRLIASFGGDYRLNIWDSVTGEIYTNIAVPQDTALFSIVWSADGSEVIYARSTGELVRVPAPELPDPTPTDTLMP
jgi:WD40 repeat protein